MAEYATITEHDQLLIARDALRGAESDHYRRSHEPETTTPENLEELESRIERWKAEIERLEALVAEELPPVQPPPE